MSGNFLVGANTYDPAWKDHSTGGGTSFTLDYSGTTNATLCIIGGVVQEPGVDFTVAGTALTTTTSVTSGVGVITCQLYKLGRLTVPADNSVTSAKIADDQIDSEHYVDGSIDEAHIANDAVNFATHLKAGTDGELITWDASGDPAAVAVGTSGHVLTSNGAGAAPTFQSAVGLQTIFIPVAAMRPTSSNGCAGITDVETTSGRPDLQVLDFDTSSDEHAQFQIAFPKSWDEGTITYRVFWTSTASDTDGVAWGLQGVSVVNDGTIDVAYGTGVVVTDDNISAAEDCLVTSTSSAVTIASAAADTMTFFRIYRDVSDANDDMTEDARLIGVQIFFTTDALTDA